MPVSISVVIVTYNSADHILECLKSIDSQADRFEVEILVVDNNSSDATRGILESFSPDFCSFTRIYNDENRLFAPATNQGLREANGEYLLILNPDTRLEPEALLLLIEYIRGDRKAGAVAPQLLNPDGTIQPSCRRFPRHRDVVFHSFGLHKLFPKSPLFNGWKMGDFSHQETREVDQPQGAALLTSRTVLKRVGEFDESFPMFFNDVDWCRRVRNAGYAIVYYPQAKVTHHRGASVNQVKWKMIVRSHVSFFRYFEKYYDSALLQLYNFVVALLLYGSIPLRILGQTLRKKF